MDKKKAGGLLSVSRTASKATHLPQRTSLSMSYGHHNILYIFFGKFQSFSEIILNYFLPPQVIQDSLYLFFNGHGVRIKHDLRF